MWHLSPVTFVWIYKVEGLEFGGLEIGGDDRHFLSSSACLFFGFVYFG